MLPGVGMQAKTKRTRLAKRVAAGMASDLARQLNIAKGLPMTLTIQHDGPPFKRPIILQRTSSTWWKACCATYATRRLGCFHTTPSCKAPAHCKRCR